MHKGFRNKKFLYETLFSFYSKLLRWQAFSKSMIAINKEAKKKKKKKKDSKKEKSKKKEIQ